MKKKVISIIMCLILVSLLSGCGVQMAENGKPVAGGADMPNNSDVIDTEKSIETTIENQDEEQGKESFDEAFENNTLGMTLTAKNISNTGLTLVFAKSGGTVTGELLTGCDFTLERNENGDWEQVDTIIPEDELVWHQLAYSLTKDGILELDIEWSYIYGELNSGKYRIRKNITDFRKAGDYDTYDVYCEFIVR